MCKYISIVITLIFVSGCQTNNSLDTPSGLAEFTAFSGVSEIVKILNSDCLRKGGTPLPSGSALIMQSAENAMAYSRQIMAQYGMTMPTQTASNRPTSFGCDIGKASLRDDFLVSMLRGVQSSPTNLVENYEIYPLDTKKTLIRGSVQRVRTNVYGIREVTGSGTHEELKDLNNQLSSMFDHL